MWTSEHKARLLGQNRCRERDVEYNHHSFVLLIMILSLLKNQLSWKKDLASTQIEWMREKAFLEKAAYEIERHVHGYRSSAIGTAGCLQRSCAASKHHAFSNPPRNKRMLTAVGRARISTSELPRNCRARKKYLGFTGGPEFCTAAFSGREMRTLIH